MEPVGHCVSDDEPSVIGEYMLLQRLGEGSYGSVYLAEHMRTHERYAIKEINPLCSDESAVAAFVRHEAQIMQGLHHPHVVRFYQLLNTTTKFYFVMELADGGELFDKIIAEQAFPDEVARKYFQQLISAIYYCHSNNIAHRDLKVENLLLDHEGKLKICDFSVSTSKTLAAEESEIWQQAAGTTNYMCPELFRDPQSADPFRSDLYAAGVILYFMLVGELPFDGCDEEETEHRIINGDYDPERIANIHARELVMSMLEMDPKKRATVEDVMLNEWFLEDLDNSLFPDDLPKAVKEKLFEKKGSCRSFLDFHRDSSHEHQLDDLTEEEEHVLRKAFDAIDVDHNGDKITKDELRDCLIALNHGELVSSDDVTTVAELFHPASRDCITYAEFRKAWVEDDIGHAKFRYDQVFTLPKIAELNHPTANRNVMKLLRQSFDSLDETHVGAFTRESLQQLFRKSSIKVTDEELESLVESLTAINHKKTVTFDDFFHAIAEDELLVRHPLGKRLASALDLMKVAHLGEISELVHGGITVLGTPADVLQCLQDRAGKLIHIGWCINGRQRIFHSPDSEFAILPPPLLSSTQSFSRSSSMVSPSPVPDHETHTFHFNRPPSHASSSMATPTDGDKDETGSNGGASVTSLESYQALLTGYEPSHERSSSGVTHSTQAHFQHHHHHSSSNPNHQHQSSGSSGSSPNAPNHNRIFSAPPQQTNPLLSDTPRLSAGMSPGRSNVKCIVDVQLTPAAAAGYCTVKIRRISGRTRDFHSAAQHIANAIAPEREQCLKNCLAVDEGELL